MCARCHLVTRCLAALALTAVPAAAQVEDRPMLTSTAAMTMIHGCLTKAAEEGWRMHIAIIDNHGNLKRRYGCQRRHLRSCGHLTPPA